MLKYRLDKLFKQYGIEDPAGFLIKNGFKKSTARRIADGKFKDLSNKTKELLCLTFKCDFEYLLEWLPDDDIVGDWSLSNLLPREEIDLEKVIRENSNIVSGQLPKNISVLKKSETKN